MQEHKTSKIKKLKLFFRKLLMKKLQYAGDPMKLQIINPSDGAFGPMLGIELDRAVELHGKIKAAWNTPAKTFEHIIEQANEHCKHPNEFAFYFYELGQIVGRHTTMNESIERLSKMFGQ